jgi:cytochrome c oxidase subunit 3
MLFAGLISAFHIIKSQAAGGIWPPLGEALLPVTETLLNTAALLLSGALLIVAHRCLKSDQEKARKWFLASTLLGVAFVLLQGKEWAGLLSEGLTLTSSAHGGFFYLIIGTHAVHAVAAICALFYVYFRMGGPGFSPVQFYVAETFWYFVVAVWPILYWQIYLA